MKRRIWVAIRRDKLDCFIAEIADDYTNLCAEVNRTRLKDPKYNAACPVIFAKERDLPEMPHYETWRAAP